MEDKDKIIRELTAENTELRQKIADLQDLLEQCKVLLESLDLKNKLLDLK